MEGRVDREIWPIELIKVETEQIERPWQEVVKTETVQEAVHPTAKRQPVDFQYHRLNWNFLKLMAQIANYAAEKYGSVEQYTDSRLEGEKSPLNHIPEHMRQYITREPHDKFTDPKFHLAAIAYNAMMEFWYLEHGGPTVGEELYK